MKLNIQRFAVTKSTTFAESNISIEDNTSTLKITIQFSPNNDVTYFSSKTLNCTCNGVKQSASVSLPKGGSVKKTFTFNGIKHDTDGTKSVSWNWSCATGTSVLGTISASGTRTLETIPQASEIISVSSGTTPYYPVIVWQPKSVDFKFKVEYKAGNYSVISGLIAPQQTLQYSYSGLLIANSLFSYFPSTSVVTLRATLYTYKSDGTTEVGRSVYDFNVALDSSVKPNLTIKSLNEANDVMIDLNWKDGNNKPIFVQNRSQLGITYSVYPYPTNLPASNVATTITANGQTFTQAGYNNSSQIDYTITTGKLNTNTTITATARDTRSRQDTKTQTYSVVPYSNPSITIAQAQRCRQDGTLDNEGTYVKFSFSGSVSPVSNHNDSYFRISYKKENEDNYTDVLLSTSYTYNQTDVVSSFTISKDYTYDIKFSIEDSFTTTEIVRTLDTGFDLMNFNPNGKAMAIGKVSEAGANEEKFEVAVPTTMNDLLTMNTPTNGYSMIDIKAGSNHNEASVQYYNNDRTKGYVAGYGTAGNDGFGIYSHETGRNVLTVDKNGVANSPSGYYSKDTGNVNTLSNNDGTLIVKRATLPDDSTPNNGVVLEYSGYSGWGGQLYMGDNADMGLWWNGWNNGTRGTWKRIPMSIWYPVETIAIGSMTVLEDNGVFYNPTTGEVRIQWLSVRLDADYTRYNALFYFRVNIDGTYQTLTPKGYLAFIPSNSGQTFYPCFVANSGVILRDNIANGTYLYFMTSYLH